ncbi:hypothetical protein [Planobispora rosea]|uniref:hypothetical protein n=1 Tax=Planobispora rosea TaxID=35762 RepID=UPI001670A0E4|nr:hypothetical protein [Planobispora rosea]
MPKRYEDVDVTDVEVEILTPETDPDDHSLDLNTGNYALAIGNPWSSAFALTGSPEDLWAFMLRIFTLLQQELPDAPRHDRTPPPVRGRSARATAGTLSTQLRQFPPEYEVWVSTPATPEGYQPLTGDLALGSDPDPAPGDPRRFIVAGTGPCGTAGAGGQPSGGSGRAHPQETG